MNNEKEHLLRQYVREQAFSFSFYAVFLCILALVCILNHLPFQPVLYVAFLGTLIGGVMHLVRFLGWRRTYRERMRKRINPAEFVAETEVNTLQEQVLFDGLKKSVQDYAKLEAEFREKERDSRDYYTTWVHQVKTPISVLRMLFQNKDDEEYSMMKDQLFRIEQYVEMALNYVRIGAGDYVFVRCSLDEIIRRSVRNFAPQFVRSHLYLKYEGTEAMVITDAKWLQFILEQILSNAVKYTYKGGVTITADEQTIAIRDTGIGIAEEDLPRIFDHGYTGYNGRSGLHATGLGLYLSRKAGEELGITITAESVLGEGSTFVIHLNQKERIID